MDRFVLVPLIWCLIGFITWGYLVLDNKRCTLSDLILLPMVVLAGPIITIITIVPISIMFLFEIDTYMEKADKIILWEKK